LCVIDRQAERILMPLQRLGYSKPLAGYSSGCQQRRKGLSPELRTSGRIVGPCQVGVLSQDRCAVMVGDQLSEFFRAIARDLLEPARGLSMSACSPDSWQARISHVAYEGMFENELELAG